MILADTSVWIDHLHTSEPRLVEALEQVLVLQHPMVVGELALGSIKGRSEFMRLLANLPAARVSTHEELMGLVESEGLYGRGLSIVDAHLLASARLTPGARLWTRDRQLLRAASVLQLAIVPESA